MGKRKLWCGRLMRNKLSHCSGLREKIDILVSLMSVLLELLTALLEYIDLILQLSFFQQEFTLSYEYLTYYADMLNAFRYLLCSKLCQHNRRVPTREYIDRKIKTHCSVSCGPRSRRVTPVSILTGRKKTQFSHLRSSVLP